jgi:hypothetical protein
MSTAIADVVRIWSPARIGQDGIPRNEIADPEMLTPSDAESFPTGEAAIAARLQVIIGRMILKILLTNPSLI